MSKRKSKKTEQPAGNTPAIYERRHLEVHVGQLCASPLNPRRVKAADYELRLRELADSIAQLGVIEAPVVRQSGETDDGRLRYEVLAGERRWRASVLAAEQVPARAWLDVVEVVDVPDDVAFRIAVAENDQREDMHPIDQCDAFVRLRDEQHASVARIAAMMGRTEQYVYDRLRLEQLTAEGRAAFVEGRISLGVALLIARVATPSAQDAALRKLLTLYGDGEVPVSAARELVKQRLMVIEDAPFDVHDEHARGGSCTSCPKRSDAQQALFRELLDGNRCTDPECWDGKVEDHWRAVSARAAERGLKVADEETARKVFPTTYGLSNGYVDLDAWSDEDPTKTWREQLAGCEHVEVMLVRAPDGRPMEVASLRTLRRAESEADRARDDAAIAAARQDAEIRRLVSRRVRDAIATQLRGGAWNKSAFWTAFAAIIIDWWDTAPVDAEMRDRHGLKVRARGEEKGGDGDELAKLRDAAAAMTDAGRLALIVDLVLDGTGLMQSAKPGDTESALLAALGVDWQAIARHTTKTVRAAHKARAT
jgi:ParB/RepB/Spo0J family partition protein